MKELLNFSKNDINSLSDLFASDETPAYQKAIQLKALENFLKLAKSKIQDDVINELEEENNRTYDGLKIYKSTSPTRYSYDHNEEWKRLNSEVKKVADEQKEIEKKMKAAFNNGVSFIDNDSGEVFEPAKYKSGGQETFVIK